MKTKKTLCICLAVIAVIAVFTGAIDLSRGETAHQNDAAYAESKITEADAMLSLARRLGAEQVIYSAAGQPIRSGYEDEMFTTGLYETVDRYRDENRLYQGVASLAALPELRGEIAPGATYAEIWSAARTVYTDELKDVDAAAHQSAVRNGVLLGLGVCAMVLSIAMLIALSRREEASRSAQTRDYRSDRHSGTPILHLG